ncbi:MAG: B12-binding domain-containing radical SAM protein [Verrucomicrobia bacterium]|nr:B12-binding domain-containing radical SAM protein [Verrucomicrobiota bacterium]
MIAPLDHRTKCLLVQARFSQFSFWNYVDVCKIVGAKYPAAPLGLMTVAALLPQDWTLKLVDENVEPLLDEHFEWADIVCTGGMLPQQQSVLSVIDKAHAHGCRVVVGGPDPTAQPTLYESADYLVQGEGELTIPMLIEDLARGATSGVYASPDRPDMAHAVVPRYDLIRFKDYIQVGVQYSRGCPFNCEFCDIIELYGRKQRTKPPEQVMKELQVLYDLGYRGHIDFVDDNFVGNKRKVKALLPAIRAWSEAHGYPFYFSTEASIEFADDDELLGMMRDVDFRYVFVGIETPDDEVLKQAQKTQNLHRSLTRSLTRIRAHGMIVNAGFIMGFDNETDQTADRMIRCIQDSGICMAMLGMLYALPSTQLTRRLRREGRLLDNGSKQRTNSTDVDQMTSGLNFVTARPRSKILEDYVRVLKYIYDPANYYERIASTALNLRRVDKYRPSFGRILRAARSFLRLCAKTAFRRRTGPLFWRLLVKVLLRNPRAAESAVNLAAMFIHFEKQCRFIVENAGRRLAQIEEHGEELRARTRCEDVRNVRPAEALMLSEAE